jgi:hypothetical protein
MLHKNLINHSCVPAHCPLFKRHTKICDILLYFKNSTKARPAVSFMLSQILKFVNLYEIQVEWGGGGGGSVVFVTSQVKGTVQRFGSG